MATQKRVYILQTRVKQKLEGAMTTLEDRFVLACGRRGFASLTRQMDAFIEHVNTRYGETATRQAPVVATSYIREMKPKADGTFADPGFYLREKHLRLPPFPQALPAGETGHPETAVNL